MARLTDELRSRLRGLIEEHGLQRIGLQIEWVALPTVRLLPTEPDDYRAVGNTRFGGDPDLPEGWTWPTEKDADVAFGGDPDEWEEDDENRYLVFLAQVNLGELPRPAADPLPPSGMLYFFLGADDLDANDLVHLVRYHPGDASTLRRVPHPGPENSVPCSFQDKPTFKAYRVAAEAGISLPGYDMRAFDELELDGDGPDLTEEYFALLEALVPDGPGRTRRGSQLLGYATLLEDVPEDWEQQALLFQIDSDKRIGMSWWDAGLVHFMISPDALAKGDFSRTYAGIYTT